MKQKILSGAAVFFGVAGFTFILAALCTDNWVENGNRNNGLWKACENDNCTNLIIGQNRAYTNYEMVRGFGVLTAILTLLGTVVTIVNAVVKKEIGASVMATLFLMAAFFGLTCIGLFTSLAGRQPSVSWGYSFGLGWAAFPTTLTAGLIMIYMEFRSD